MKKTQIVKRKVEVIIDVTCDCCGKSCKIDVTRDGHFNLEYMTLKATWGYGSKYDFEYWEAQVCEACVDKKFKGIKFKKEEYDWTTGDTVSQQKKKRNEMGLNYEYRRKHNLQVPRNTKTYKSAGKRA